MFVYRQKTNGEIFELSYDNNCFIPTATSDFIINACLKNFTSANKLLDLGCGIGVVGLTLSHFMKIKSLHSSDISDEALNHCKMNSQKHNISNNIRHGALFEPWENEKFDLIINDISGISEDIANVSPWFKFAPCDSGSDGLKLTKKIINQAKNYLSENGNIIFPVISLSDHQELLRYADTKFKSLKKLSSNKWFLPDDMSEKHDRILKKLKDKGIIYFEEKFGKKVCFTDIYLGNF
jgi:HemK-like putative methylase